MRQLFGLLLISFLLASCFVLSPREVIRPDDDRDTDLIAEEALEEWEIEKDFQQREEWAEQELENYEATDAL